MPAGRRGAPDPARRFAIVRAVSPAWTTNSTWAWSLEAGVVSAAPRSSRPTSLMNGSSSAAGLSSATLRIVSLTTARSAISRIASTMRGKDQGEDQEAQDPEQAAAPPRSAAAARFGRLREGWDGFGRVGVGIVRMGRRGAAVPRASAGADRHGLVSWGSWAFEVDERRRASCVDLVLQDDGGGLSIDSRAI